MSIHYYQGYLYCYYQRADADGDFGRICDMIERAKSSGEPAAQFGYDVVLVSTTAHFKQAIMVTANDLSLTFDANAVIKQISRSGDMPMKFNDVEGMNPAKVNAFFNEQGAQVLNSRHFQPGAVAPQSKAPPGNKGGVVGRPRRAFSAEEEALPSRSFLFRCGCWLGRSLGLIAPRNRAKK